MEVYIVMLIISVIFAFLSDKVKSKNIKKILYFLSFLPFFVISTIRYDVGTDYLGRYVTSFNLIKSGIDVPSLEFIFKLMIKGCLLFSENFILLFAVTSAIILIPIFKIIYQKSKYPILSIILFLLGGFFFQSLNLVRQYISVSLLLCGFYYLIEDKKINYIVCLIIAVLFHYSAIIGLAYIPIYYFSNKAKKISVLKVCLIVCLIVLLHNQIGHLIRYLLSLTKYTSYIGGKFDNSSFSTISFVIQLMIFLLLNLVSSLNKNSDEKNFENYYFINFQFCALIAIALSSIFSLFYRITYFFTIFQIISIPSFIFKIEKPKDRMMIAILFITIFMGIMFHSNILNNYNEVIPYRTIFSVN